MGWSHATAFRQVTTRTHSKNSIISPLHCIGSASARGVQNAVNHRPPGLASVGRDVRIPKGSIAMQALTALWPQAAKMRIGAPVRRVWGLPPLQCLLYPAGVVSVPRQRGIHTANYSGCIKLNKVKGYLAMQALKPPRSTPPL